MRHLNYVLLFAIAFIVSCTNPRDKSEHVSKKYGDALVCESPKYYIGEVSKSKQDNVIGKWEQNTLGTRPYPKSIHQLLSNDSMYYAFITIAILWMSIYLIVYKSKRKRRTEKRKTE